VGSRMKPRGMRWFTIVKQLAPGVRVRALVALSEETITDISETECEELFIRLCPEKWRNALARWGDR
jgi:hypothetical protein